MTRHGDVLPIKVGRALCVAGIPTGCSSPNGHYVRVGVILTALDFGWEDEAAADAAATYEDAWHQEGWPHFDTFDEMVTQAEEYLNSITEGGLWHWQDGDFRLDNTIVCGECGDPRFVEGDDDCSEHLWWG